MKDLTKIELIQFETIVRGLRKEAKSESQRIRAKYLNEEGLNLSKNHNIPLDEARQRLINRSKGFLSGDDALILDDGTAVRVRDIIKEPEKNDGKTLPDPIEPEYGGGRNKAKIFSNIGTGTPVIYSQAHGGRTFRLVHDFDDLTNIIEQDLTFSIEKLLRLVAEGDLDEEEQENLLKLWKEKRGGNLRKLRRKLETAAVACVEPVDPWEPPYNTPEYASLNLQYGMAMMGTKAVIIEEKHDDDGLEPHEFVAHRPSELRLFYENKRLPRQNSKVDANVFDLWMKSVWRNTFTGIEFRPDSSVFRIGPRAIQQGGIYNMWMGYTMEPVNGDCSLIVSHLNEVWCNGNEEMFDYVMNWLADMFQHPNRQGKTALVLRSGQGTGKNIIMDGIIARLLGRHALIATRKDDFLGKFNGGLGMAIFIFANEAVWGGDKEREGTLKALITDDFMTIEKKFLDSIRVRNYIHLIFASNENWAAPVGIGDRRFVYPDVSNHRAGDFDYFKKLAAQIENGGCAAFLHEMLNRDLSGVDLTKFPQNQSQQRLTDQLQTASAHIKFLHDVLQDPYLGSYLTDPTIVNASNLYALQPWGRGSWVTPKDLFYQMYLKFCRDSRNNHPEIKEVLFRNITRDLPRLMASTKPSHGSNRVPSLKFPPVDAARKIFTENTKLAVTWED